VLRRGDERRLAGPCGSGGTLHLLFSSVYNITRHDGNRRDLSY